LRPTIDHQVVNLIPGGAHKRKHLYGHGIHEVGERFDRMGNRHSTWCKLPSSNAWIRSILSSLRLITGLQFSIIVASAARVGNRQTEWEQKPLARGTDLEPEMKSGSGRPVSTIVRLLQPMPVCF
jgi:hypothetical protein